VAENKVNDAVVNLSNASIAIGVQLNINASRELSEINDFRSRYAMFVVSTNMTSNTRTFNRKCYHARREREPSRIPVKELTCVLKKGGN